MGHGTVSKHTQFALAFLVLATLASAITGCPAEEPQPVERGLTAERITAARTDPGWPEEGTVTTWAAEEDAITLRDPLDDENPYRDQYGEWEIWCYRNARHPDDPENDKYYEEGWPDEWLYLNAAVTRDGWIIPVIPERLSVFFATLGYSGHFFDWSDRIAYVAGMGELDDAGKAALVKDFASFKAPYLHPVPAWLAAAPPRAAMHLPDGRFALFGEPGTGDGFEFFEFHIHDLTDPEMSWAVYSADGVLEDTGNPGEYWWQLFVKDFEALTGVAFEDVTTQTMRNRVIWFSQPPSIGGSFTWDGKDLRNDIGDIHSEAVFDPRYLMVITGPELPHINKIQQSVELIPPHGWGLGVTDLAELDMHKPIASGSTQFSDKTPYIQVKPLDDPANPYRDYYVEWDRFNFANHELLCRNYSYNPRVLERDYNIWDFHDLLVENGLGTYDMSFHQPYIRVDDDGFVVPELLATEMYNCTDPGLAPDIVSHIRDNTQGNFSIYSAWFIDEELEQRMLLAQDLVIAKYLPLIPDWLAADPPEFVFQMPDGEYVAYGPLGSLDTEPRNTHMVAVGAEERPGWRPWHLYDASGKEVCSVEEGNQWWEVYFTDFKEVYAELGGADAYRYYFMDGYISFDSRTDFQDRHFYTYKGEPVERMDKIWDENMFDQIYGGHLAAMREVQLELLK